VAPSSPVTAAAACSGGAGVTAEVILRAAAIPHDAIPDGSLPHIKPTGYSPTRPYRCRVVRQAIMRSPPAEPIL
jgi:hypothetical protein